MIRIALIDDEQPALLISESTISSYFHNKGHEVRIDAFKNPLSFLANEKEEAYDLVFLDIDMPQRNGIDVAREIVDIKKDTTLIFLSQREDLVFDTLPLHPFGFIRKSRIIEDFPKVLDLYERTLLEAKENDMSLSFNSKNGLVSFHKDEILYIEGSRNYQEFHLRDGKKEYIRIPMKELEEQLAPLGFLRIQKGFLVNSVFIRKIERKSVILINSETLPLSEKIHDSVLEKYMEITREKKQIFLD